MTDTPHESNSPSTWRDIRRQRRIRRAAAGLTRWPTADHAHWAWMVLDAQLNQRPADAILRRATAFARGEFLRLEEAERERAERAAAHPLETPRLRELAAELDTAIVNEAPQDRIVAAYRAQRVIEAARARARHAAGRALGRELVARLRACRRALAPRPTPRARIAQRLGVRGHRAARRVTSTSSGGGDDSGPAGADPPPPVKVSYSASCACWVRP